MPGKKNVRNGKRSQKRAQRVPKNLPMMSKVPGSTRVNLTYSAPAQQIVESAAGTGVTYFYRLNSVFDPDASGVGAVAIGYNTYSALYLNYKVHRVTVRLTGFVGGGTGNSHFANVSMAPIPSQSVVPANRATWKTIPGGVTACITSSSNGGMNRVSYTKSYELARVAAVTKQQYANDMDFSGAIASNPARQMYLMVSLDSAGSSTVMGLTYAITISYLVEWFNPVPLQ